jgi:hypothetical protein
MVFVDEAKIVGLGIAQELQPQGFGEKSPVALEDKRVAAVSAEPLLLQLAAREPELACLLGGVGSGFFEEGDVVAKKKGDARLLGHLAASLGPQGGKVNGDFCASADRLRRGSIGRMGGPDSGSALST